MRSVSRIGVLVAVKDVHRGHMVEQTALNDALAAPSTVRFNYSLTFHPHYIQQLRIPNKLERLLTTFSQSLAWIVKRSPKRKRQRDTQMLITLPKAANPAQITMESRTDAAGPGAKDEGLEKLDFSYTQL